eukprot:753381-Hanusia_phi.AAC.1
MVLKGNVPSCGTWLASSGHPAIGQVGVPFPCPDWRLYWTMATSPRMAQTMPRMWRATWPINMSILLQRGELFMRMLSDVKMRNKTIPRACQLNNVELSVPKPPSARMIHAIIIPSSASAQTLGRSQTRNIAHNAETIRSRKPQDKPSAGKCETLACR